MKTNWDKFVEDVEDTAKEREEIKHSILGDYPVFL